MKRSIPLLLSLLFMLPFGARAQEVTIEKVWYGEYKAEPKEIKDPTAPNGSRYELSDWSLIVQTDTIRHRDNVQFGVSYVPRGPRGTIDLEHVYFLPDDRGLASTDRQPDFRLKQPTKSGEKSLISWVVPKDADLKLFKTGTYIFQIRLNGRVVSEQRFNVVP